MISAILNDSGRIRANIDLAGRIQAKAYLEIGCQSDEVFSRMPVATKIGIDPTSGGNMRMTSDAFFALLRSGKRGDLPRLYDLVFIDGDHRHPQVAKDVQNALEFLAPDGVITMHDVYPPTTPYESPSYCGTAWRAFVREARMRADVDAYVSDVDTFGLGILRKRPNTDLIVDVPSYDAMTYAMMLENEAWMRRRPHEEVMTLLGITVPENTVVIPEVGA